MEKQLELQYNHKVLIVDDEELIGKSIEKLLHRNKIDSIYINSGQKAVEIIENEKTPFSLIISDQRMPGMSGIQLLEYAKTHTPETIRFLITGFTEISVIFNAVNKGSIHRYISKSSNNTDIIQTIRYGLKQFEIYLENKDLESQLKIQNVKLYNFNSELLDNEKKHKQHVQKLDKEIAFLKIKKTELIKNNLFGADLKEIKKAMVEYKSLGNEPLTQFYGDVIKEIEKYK